MARSTRSGLRRYLSLDTAGRFALQPLERRVLLCTLEGTHLPDFHGPETTEVEPNDTIATATPFGPSDSLSGTLSSSADVDYWVASLAQGDRLRVRPGTDPGQRHYKPRVEIRDPSNAVLMTSADGHEMSFYAPAAGSYYVRISSANAYGTFTGGYGTDGGSNLIAVTISPFSGTTETEPNDTLAQATPVSSTTNFRGALASVADVDAFSFSGSAGNAISFKFSGTPSANPALRLYDPSNSEIASDLSGAGIFHVLPATGTYRFTVAGDNAGGSVSGAYVGTFIRSSGTIVSEVEPANDSFDGAVPWNLTTTPSRAVGVIDHFDDVDLYSFNFQAGRWYSFTIDSNAELMNRFGRQLSLFNEFGQQVETSYLGTLHTNAATGFGFRIERTGKHYLSIRAIDPTGVGGYSISGSQTSTFPTQRDVPLVFHDYTGQRTHLGYGPAQPLLNPQTIPLMIGMFEARYDVYDIDYTTINPGSDVIGFGAGEFGSIGAYGYGGSFNLGTRRARGDSVLDDSGANFTSLANMRNPASVMNQEIGHAAGLYAHARNPQAFMAYDSQSAMNVIGMYYPFPWTDSRVPDVESRNEREFQDWVLQAGRIAEEVEPNNSLASPQNLAGFMSEMTGDAMPRNDRVALAGKITSGTDVDVYSFTAQAGQTFAIDIDAAELQHALDATLRIYDSANNLVATSFDAVDRESGLRSVDPYLVHTFATAATYKIHVSGANATIGNYRLKLTSAASFDSDGPRVIASWPNGGVNVDGTRQLLFWFNDKLDPDTLTSENIIVRGAATGVRSGSAIFDPTDGALVWRADAQLPADAYTVTFKSGAGGITDLRGNALDGETDGTMNFPEISGNGSPGGDFITTFSIFGPDNTPAAVSSTTIRRHPYNRLLFTLNYSDELDVQSVYAPGGLVVRGAGPDNVFNSADDRFIPFDVNYDKIRQTSSSRPLEVYTRGAPDLGNYRVEGSIRDAAGNTVNVSSTFNYTSATSPLLNGPSVARSSIAAGSAVTAPTNRIELTFSAAVDPATLNSGTFTLRHSPDASFFDGNDTILTDADGIDWDPTALTATFNTASNFAGGYYLMELSGSAGGVASPTGRLLDGEWLESRIAGGDLFTLWQDTPSGDGFAGGDWRSPFVVEIDTIAPSVASSAFAYATAPHALRFGFSESVADSLTTADLVLENLTTTTTVPSGSIALSYDVADNIATFTFPGFSNGVLPEGRYRATLLSAGITDPAGNPLAADHVFNFTFLLGDANGDGTVNLADFNILAANFGQSGAHIDFTKGDFNYDGQVNLADFNVLAAKFGTILSPPATIQGSPFGSSRIGGSIDPEDRSDELLA